MVRHEEDDFVSDAAAAGFSLFVSLLSLAGVAGLSSPEPVLAARLDESLPPLPLRLSLIYQPDPLNTMPTG